MNVANVIASRIKNKEYQSGKASNPNSITSNTDTTNNIEKNNLEDIAQNNNFSNVNNNNNNITKISNYENTHYSETKENTNEHDPPYNSGNNHSYDEGNDEDDDEEEEEVVVLRVCASKHCQGIDNLEFDEETNESYCGKCRARFARIHDEGFRILLNEDDLELVQLIFKKFDRQNRGYWTYQEWAEFQELTDHPSQEVIDNPLALRDYFRDEFDITLKSLSKNSDIYVIRCTDLENMYGGYLYNNIDALVEDSEALEQEGMIDTAILE